MCSDWFLGSSNRMLWMVAEVLHRLLYMELLEHCG